MNSNRRDWKGAMLDEEITDPTSPKINGSVFIMLAESRAEVEKALKEDIYTKAGIWDWEKVQIIPVSYFVTSLLDFDGVNKMEADRERIMDETFHADTCVVS